LWCPSESVRWWFCVSPKQYDEEFIVQRTSSLTSQCFSKSVRWRVGASANQFADEFVLQRISLLTSLCCSESVRWWICVSVNQFCWLVHVVSFADELHVTSESVSLLNSAPPRKQFRSQFSAANSHVRNDVNSYNNLIIWLCNIWNTWMGTCAFFGKRMVTSYVIIKYKCADCDHWCVRLCDQDRIIDRARTPHWRNR
jgi:hypothetical protein